MIKKLIINNKRVIYYESGTNLPKLLLIHGWAGSYNNWSLVIPYLEEKFNLICPNLPGCSGSEELDTFHSVENYANFIESFVKMVKLSNFFLMGESLGGLIALEYACKNFRKIKKLILISTPLKFDVLFKIVSYAMSVLSKNKLGLLFVDKIRTSNLILSTYGRLFLVGRKAKERDFIEKQKAKSKLSSSKVFLESGGHTLVHDMTKKLINLDIPILLYFGTKDRFMKHTLKYLQKLPKNIVLITNESQHQPYRDDPRLFSQNISKFLDE